MNANMPTQAEEKEKEDNAKLREKWYDQEMLEQKLTFEKKAKWPIGLM